MEFGKAIPPLFSAGEAEDSAYRNLREAAHIETKAGRAFAEGLWDQYWPYADHHFLTESRRQFNARFWEMYLTCAVLQNSPRGCVISCPKPLGPDILLELKSQRIWIEAVTVTDGDPAKADSPVEPDPSRPGQIPDEKILLRYTNAIDAKHKQYLGYRLNGIVAEDDCYVLALNGFSLSYRWADPEIPRFLKSIFPLGALELIIDRQTGRVVNQRHQFRAAVLKGSGQSVSTEIFVNDHYRGISAILHSYANALMTAPRMGVDFVVAHNPLACHHIGRGVLGAKREYCPSVPTLMRQFSRS